MSSESITGPGGPYTVRIIGGPDRVAIEGFIQEDFTYSVTGQYGPMFEQGEFKNSLVSGIANVLKAGAGITAVNKYTTAQIWQGTSPIEFELKMAFYAETDLQFHHTIKTLAKCCAPLELAGGFLKAPSTAWNKSGNASDSLNVYIGKFLKFRDVVMHSVTPVYSPLIHESGKPVHAEVDIRFSTFFVATKQLIEEIYGGDEVSTSIFG